MRRTIFLVLTVCAAHGQEAPKSQDEAAYAAWAQEVVGAVRKGDAAPTFELFDFAALVETATAGGPDDLREKFRGEMMDALRKRGGVLHDVIGSVAAGAHFGLLRMAVRDGSPCARFRLATLEQGIYYMDIRMRRDASGRVRGIDVYSDQTGEWMSQIFARVFVPYMRDQRRSAFEKLVAGREDWLKGILHVEKAVDLERAGHPEQALEELAAIPDAVRREKACLMIRIRIAGQVDEKKFAEAVQTYLALYPDDPGSHVVALSGHIVAGRHEEALARVDALDKVIGGDPYLDIFRADLLIRTGKLDKAREFARAAAEKGPDWEDAHWVLVEVELRAKRFGELAKVLKVLAERFGYDMTQISEVPEYADFAKSPEYRALLEELKKR